MRNFFKKTISVLSAFFMCAGVIAPVRAVDSHLMYSCCEDNVMRLYLNLPGEDMNIGDVFISNEKVKILDFVRFDKETQVQTVFLFDRSVVSDKTDMIGLYLPVMQEFLMRSYENESFNVISYGEGNISEDKDFSDSAKDILESIENLTYENSSKKSLSDALEYANKKLDDGRDEVFKKIVVFTDSDSINENELDDSDDFKFPVYYILFDSEEKAVYSNNMSSSDIYTEYYKYTKETAMSAIPEVISSRSNLYCCEIEIPFDMLKKEGERMISMDFEGEGVTTSIERSVMIEPCYDFVMEQESRNMRNTILIIVALFIVIIAVIIIIARKRIKDKKVSETVTTVLPPEPLQTRTIPSARGTRVLFQECRYKAVFIDNTNNENTYEIVVEKEAFIGRNHALVDCTINEPSISQKHCKLFVRDSKLFVTDLESLNHTYVDGGMVTNEVELIDGSTIKLGRAEFEVRVIRV